MSWYGGPICVAWRTALLFDGTAGADDGARVEHVQRVQILRAGLAVAAQVEIVSKSWKRYITVKFQVLPGSSRRVQVGFHRVNLHRPTLAVAMCRVRAISGMRSRFGTPMPYSRA